MWSIRGRGLMQGRFLNERGRFVRRWCISMRGMLSIEIWSRITFCYTKKRTARSTWSSLTLGSVSSSQRQVLEWHLESDQRSSEPRKPSKYSCNKSAIMNSKLHFTVKKSTFGPLDASSTSSQPSSTHSSTNPPTRPNTKQFLPETSTTPHFAPNL